MSSKVDVYSSTEVKLVERIAELEVLLEEINDDNNNTCHRREVLKDAISLFELIRTQYKRLSQEAGTSTETKTRLKSKIRNGRERLAAAKADLRAETRSTEKHPEVRSNADDSKFQSRTLKTPSSSQALISKTRSRRDTDIEDRHIDDESRVPTNVGRESVQIAIAHDLHSEETKTNGGKNYVKEKFTLTRLRASTPTGETDENTPFDNSLISHHEHSISIQELKAKGKSQLEETDQAIERSRAIVAETQEIGIATAAKLHEQGKQLEKVGEDLDDTQRTMTVGNALLRVIRKQMVCDRCQQVLLLVITVGVVAVVIVTITQGKL